ncbi:MAG: exodeoxyribonuclease VII large subunit [Planctomycetes bacterium]|nr:exodeoxyribonuclease VII large subunit [Planctomycetota bacterium]
MNMDLFEAQSPPTPITVKDLSKKIHAVLDARVGRVDVVGQVNKPSFKHHWYFSLTDGDASIDCAMWASTVRSVQPKGWKPKQGDQVIIRGTVGHFSKYGKTQIYVEKMKPAAEEKGELQKKYEALLQELREAGWFEETNKKPLPAYPRRIAVITSATSAAVRDVIETARQRWSAVPLLIVNVPVQGDAAAPAITKAIDCVDQAAERMHIDAIIVTRGGGSLEELWSFNERTVAEATFNAKTPIVAAIGHESDTSIIELVADHRASTPTQAAMVLVPDAGELTQMVDHFASRLRTTMQRVIELGGGRMAQLSSTLDAAMTSSLHKRMRYISILNEALQAKRPHAVLRKRQERFMRIDASLHAAMTRTLSMRNGHIETLSGRLEAIGPRAVLKRGFSLTQSADGTVLRSAKEVNDGQELTTILADGTIKSRVECTS